PGQPQDLHSFPTRRSSDLLPILVRASAAVSTSAPRVLSVLVTRFLHANRVPLRSKTLLGSSGLRLYRRLDQLDRVFAGPFGGPGDRKSTRLNSSHDQISYA